MVDDADEALQGGSGLVVLPWLGFLPELREVPAPRLFLLPFPLFSCLSSPYMFLYLVLFGGSTANQADTCTTRAQAAELLYIFLLLFSFCLLFYYFFSGAYLRVCVLITTLLFLTPFARDLGLAKKVCADAMCVVHFDISHVFHNVIPE